MGCGHSKINIYPRKSRNKSNNKKTVIPEKSETVEEESDHVVLENNENVNEYDVEKNVKVKSYGGPLLAQTEISTSQQDFFNMLDEKIKNGPDYNSESETEKAAETVRLSALLKDWETASAGSRSLPATPKRRRPNIKADKIRETIPLNTNDNRNYVSQIPQSIIHQSYGITPPYRHPPPSYPLKSSYPSASSISYPPSALQYQAISPMYNSSPSYNPSPRSYASYNQQESPIKYVNSPPTLHYKHIPSYDISPKHKLYGPPQPPPPTLQAQQPIYSNGEFLQQHFYNQMQYQQYKETREQVLAKNQHASGYRMHGNGRNFQSSVTIPIVQQNQDLTVVQRKQYELT